MSPRLGPSSPFTATEFQPVLKHSRSLQFASKVKRRCSKGLG